MQRSTTVMLHHNYLDDSVFCLRDPVRALAIFCPWKYRHKYKIPIYCQYCNYPAWLISFFFLIKAGFFFNQGEEEEGDIRKSNFIPKVTASATSSNRLHNLTQANPFFPRRKKGADQMILTLSEATACSSHVIMRQDKSFVFTRQPKALRREYAPIL